MGPTLALGPTLAMGPTFATGPSIATGPTIAMGPSVPSIPNIKKNHLTHYCSKQLREEIHKCASGCASGNTIPRNWKPRLEEVIF